MSVLFNAVSPGLWRRFIQALIRRFARLAGLTLKALREQAVISFAKVAEYQRRGVMAHVVIWVKPYERENHSPDTDGYKGLCGWHGMTAGRGPCPNKPYASVKLRHVDY